MAESFSAQVAIGPDGRLWIKHGRVGRVTVLDGYSAISVSSPTSIAHSFWSTGTDSMIADDDGGHLLEFVHKKWLTHDIKARAFLPAGRNRVVYIQNKVLGVYDMAERVEKPLRRIDQTQLALFREICNTRVPTEFWVLGTYGVARFGVDGQWTEYSLKPLGLEDAQRPFVGPDDSLYLIGVRPSDGVKVLVRLVQGRWERVRQGDSGLLRGWPGSSGSLWYQDPEGLHRRLGSYIEDVERTSALTGTISSVVTEDTGSIWVATNQGVARYTPPLWQTAPEVAHIRTGVQDSYRDEDGSLWFLSGTAVLQLQNRKWTEYRFPPRWRTVSQAVQLVRAPSGTFLLLVSNPEGNSMLEFDPRRGSFREIEAPPGQTLQRILPRDKDSVWVCTRILGGQVYTLQVFDLHEFKEYLRLPPKGGLGVVRTIHHLPGGGMLLGGSGGIGRWENGAYRAIGAKEGYSDTACFRLLKLADGTLLAGGRQKVFRMEGDTWKPLRENMDFVRQMIQTRDGTVWLASGSGVHRFRDGIWLTNDSHDGLPSDMAYSLVEDREGRVWAGTTLGLSEFHPEADRDAPRTFLSRAENQAEVPPGGHARILYSGSDKWKMTEAERLLFSYRIDNGAWSPFQTGDSTNFSGLKPGPHYFQVRAMDRNGNVDPEPPTLAFTVLLPWYKEGGFLSILAGSLFLIAGLLGIAVWHYRARESMIVQLERARQAAEAANRSKGEFLANMSHEIRTPMNGVLGMTELALANETNPEQRQYLEAAKVSADSLLIVLNDILDFSKIEAGKLEFANTEFSLRDCAAEALQAVGVRAAEKLLEMTFRVAPEVPDILTGDPDRLRQVLINLVGNAVKFTSEGEVHVSFGLDSQDQDGVSIHCTVADTGVGIAPEKQKIVFEPFEQADSTTTRRFGGTGLGLAISNRLVTLMQGRIWVDSPAGRNRPPGPGGPGSVFHFTAHFAKAVHAPKVPFQTTKACLVVAPNDSQRLNLEQVLSEWGLAVRSLSDTERIATVLRSAADGGTPIALVVLDVASLTMALGAVAQIREYDTEGRIRIVQLRPPTRTLTRVDLRGAGVDAFLLKPAKHSALRSTVAALLESPAREGGRSPDSALAEGPRRLRVLVAEDNTVNQLLARRLLERRGHMVEVVNNGHAAVKAAAEERFDLLLMDVQMPGMDGLEATAAIRKAEQGRSHLPIVAMTAHALQGDRERCLAQGMDHYLAKPVRAEQLDEILERILRSGDGQKSDLKALDAATRSSSEADPVTSGD